jgi:hypothetical protein
MMKLISLLAGRARTAVLLACAVFSAACSTSPTTGRTQFNILPEQLETSVPDLRFEVHTLLTSKTDYCGEEEIPCPALVQAEQLSKRVAPIADLLGYKAVELSPELAKRVPLVEVFVVHKDSPSVISSAGGKIAVSSAMAQLDLPDADLALALAREFGRLAAAHHRESTSAGLAVSIVAGSPLAGAYLATSILADILFPMGALFKLGISLIGSMGAEQLVEISQQEEADEFAARLLLAAGYDLRALARPHPGLEEGAVRIGWLPRFVASRAKVAGMTPSAQEMAKGSAEGESAPEGKSGTGVPSPASAPKTVSDTDPPQTVAKVEADPAPATPVATAIVEPETAPLLKTEGGAPATAQSAKEVAEKEPLAARPEAMTPPAATAIVEPESAPLVKTEGEAPAAAQSAREVAEKEPLVARPEAMTPPATVAVTVVAEPASAPAARSEVGTPSIAAADKTVAEPESRPRERKAVETPPAQTPSLPDTKQDPPREAKTATPALQSDAARKPQAGPSKAKPAAAKKTSKPAAKKTKKPQKKKARNAAP